jgi:NAD(P)-dependent dehydrogenase (short-subunit alcohol dehydrogenase family)
LFEIPPVPHFPKFVLLSQPALTRTSEIKGARASIYVASAAFRFEVPVANLRQPVQELQIGGAGRQVPAITTREKFMGRLEGKSVIITGAGSGIGRAASLLFTREGAKLIAVDRAEGVKETVEQVRKAGGTAEAVVADAGSEKDVIAFIDRAVSTYGRLDAIWANAGISGGLVPLAEQTVEQWQEILRINLIGPFLAIKHSMPHMIKQKYGAIVCTASVAGLKSGASGHPYAASKAGVISLVQTTAYSLSGTGVRINAVCPGLIETGMTKPIFDNAKQRGTDGKIGQLNPLKRAGQPHELAAMGLFLASDDASYVNGQAIPVDGGLTASMPYAGKPI